MASPSEPAITISELLEDPGKRPSKHNVARTSSNLGVELQTDLSPLSIQFTSVLGSLEHVYPSQLSWSKLDVWAHAGPNHKKGSKEYVASHMKHILHSGNLFLLLTALLKSFFNVFCLPFYKVSGKVLPGQLVGVLGASGSGKTTLLNVLAARNLNGLEVKGRIYINGPVSANEIKSKCAYVQQQDLFFGTLTVREHLYLQVMLPINLKLSNLSTDSNLSCFSNKVSPQITQTTAE